MRLVRYTYPSFRALAPVSGRFSPLPWSGLETEIDRLFATAPGDLDPVEPSNRFPIDLHEDKGNTYLRAELPGVKRDDIKVELTDGTLTIAASRQAPAHATGSGQALDGKAADAITFSRSLSLTDDVEADKISATYENGVLTVTLPKREVAAPKKITIAVQ